MAAPVRYGQTPLARQISNMAGSINQQLMAERPTGTPWADKLTAKQKPSPTTPQKRPDTDREKNLIDILAQQIEADTGADRATSRALAQQLGLREMQWQQPAPLPELMNIPQVPHVSPQDRGAAIGAPTPMGLGPSLESATQLGFGSRNVAVPSYRDEPLVYGFPEGRGDVLVGSGVGVQDDEARESIQEFKSVFDMADPREKVGMTQALMDFGIPDIAKADIRLFIESPERKGWMTPAIRDRYIDEISGIIGMSDADARNILQIAPESGYELREYQEKRKIRERELAENPPIAMPPEATLAEHLSYDSQGKQDIWNMMKENLPMYMSMAPWAKAQLEKEQMNAARQFDLVVQDPSSKWFIGHRDPTGEKRQKYKNYEKYLNAYFDPEDGETTRWNKKEWIMNLNKTKNYKDSLLEMEAAGDFSGLAEGKKYISSSLFDGLNAIANDPKTAKALIMDLEERGSEGMEWRTEGPILEGKIDTFLLGLTTSGVLNKHDSKEARHEAGIATIRKYLEGGF